MYLETHFTLFEGLFCARSFYYIRVDTASQMEAIGHNSDGLYPSTVYG